jgi:hypothetical protein
MTIIFNGDVNTYGFAPWNTGDVDNQDMGANGTILQGGQITNAGIPGFIDLVPDPAGSGLTVIRTTVNQTDNTTYGNKRSELSLNKDPLPYPTERWYAFSTYIPLGVTPSEEITIWQVHNSPDTSPDEVAAAIPPTMECDMSLLDGEPVFRIYNAYDAAATSTPGSPTARTLCTVPLVQGVWVDWVLHAIWSGTAGSGKLEIYKDRRIIFSENNHINTYNDAAARGGGGPYARMGIYHWATTWTVPTYVMYYKGHVVGDASSSFLEVTGTTQLETIIGRGGIAP